MRNQGQQIRTQRMLLCDLDRVEDELQIGTDKMDPGAGGCRLSRQRRYRTRRCTGAHIRSGC
ncbi:hypothetical protein D9M68_885630 [compost metagenome]